MSLIAKSNYGIKDQIAQTVFTSLRLTKIPQQNIQIFTPHGSGAVTCRQNVFMVKVFHAEENRQTLSAGICFSEPRGAAALQRQQSGRRADGHTFEYGDGETNKYNSNYPPSPTERGGNPAVI